MNDEKLKVLYDQVAKRCYITSDDSLIKDRLTSIIDNAIFNVSSLLAIPEKFDFSKEKVLPKLSNVQGTVS